MHKVIIIGGGLTGLTLAFYLKKAGITPLVLEKNDRLGGAINTITKNGFVVEAGPNTGAISNPEVVELFEDLKGSTEIAVANRQANKRLIWKDNQWEPLPSGPISAIRTPLFTTLDKFRVLGEPFRNKGTNPHESLADLVRRRLGKSFLDYAIDPFISGIYAGDPEKIIPKYALPKLYNLEQNYGSFVKGAAKKKKEPKTERDQKASREVFAAKGGLLNLIEALTLEIGHTNIETNCSDISVSQLEEGYNVEYKKNGKTLVISSEIAITTTAAHELPGLLSFLTKDQATTYHSMQYAPMVQIAMGFRRWVGMKLDSFGGLVPGKENKSVLGILFPSAIFPGRAPENGAVLSVFCGGIRNKHLYDLSNEELFETIREDVKKMTRLPALMPDLLEFFRYEKAIPQYTVHMEKILETTATLQLQNKGLYIAGNVKDGIGMPDRIKQARDIAEEIIAKFK